MKKKKLIRSMALPAAVVFVLAFAVLLCKRPVDDALYEEHIARLNAHVAAVTQEQQTYLTKTAEKLGAADMSDIGKSRIVAEIQSEILRENQKIDQPKKYLWLSNPQGEFVFGVPAQAFAKLNDNYDKNLNVIREDGYYKDRNDYLMKLIQIHDQLDFTERERSSQSEDMNFNTPGIVRSWRFYREHNNFYYGETHVRPTTLVLSAPVTQQAGAVAGNLFLKVDDSNNGILYLNRNEALRDSLYHWLIEPIAGFFAVISGLFLWFLLPSWVYIDAQQRSVSNPAVWAFIVLISLVFGFAIYLITRPSTIKSSQCPQCEKELNGGGMFCPHCGFDLSGSFCPQCQYPIKPEWVFCPSCRAELAQRQAQEAAARSLEQLEAQSKKTGAQLTASN